MTFFTTRTAKPQSLQSRCDAGPVDVVALATKHPPSSLLQANTSTMNDRMGDVPMWAVESDEEEEDEGGDIEMGAVKEEEPQYMTHFFNEVETIKADIEFVKRATAKITKLSEEAIHATTTEKEQALSKKLKPIVNETNKTAKRTKNLLGLFKEETKNLKTEGKLKPSDERYVAWRLAVGCSVNPLDFSLCVSLHCCAHYILPCHRVRDNLCNTLTRKFIDEMKFYQEAQQKYKTDIQKKMKRQVQIVKPDATDARSGRDYEERRRKRRLYKEQILAGGVSDQIK